MDPLSITATCIGLASTITRTSLVVISFVKDVRAARSDLDAVSHQLLSLKTILELLADDINDSNSHFIPQTLQKQITGIVTCCTGVVVEIEQTLKKHEGGKPNQAVRWVASGKGEVANLKLILEAHKSALEIALDTVTLTLAREIKADTQEILNDTSAIKEDTAHILAEIARLQEKLPQDGNQRGAGFMLERYLDNLTSYAETICDPLLDSSHGSRSTSRPGSSGKHAWYDDPPLPMVQERRRQASVEQPMFSTNHLPAPSSPEKLGEERPSQEKPRPFHKQEEAIETRVIMPPTPEAVSPVRSQSHENSQDDAAVVGPSFIERQLEIKQNEDFETLENIVRLEHVEVNANRPQPPEISKIPQALLPSSISAESKLDPKEPNNETFQDDTLGLDYGTLPKTSVKSDEHPNESRSSDSPSSEGWGDRTSLETTHEKVFASEVQVGRARHQIARLDDSWKLAAARHGLSYEQFRHKALLDKAAAASTEQINKEECDLPQTKPVGQEAEFSPIDVANSLALEATQPFGHIFCWMNGLSIESDVLGAVDEHNVQISESEKPHSLHDFDDIGRPYAAVDWTDSDNFSSAAVSSWEHDHGADTLSDYAHQKEQRASSVSVQEPNTDPELGHWAREYAPFVRAQEAGSNPGSGVDKYANGKNFGSPTANIQDPVAEPMGEINTGGDHQTTYNMKPSVVTTTADTGAVYTEFGVDPLQSLWEKRPKTAAVQDQASIKALNGAIFSSQGMHSSKYRPPKPRKPRPKQSFQPKFIGNESKENFTDRLRHAFRTQQFGFIKKIADANSNITTKDSDLPKITEWKVDDPELLPKGHCKVYPGPSAGIRDEIGRVLGGLKIRYYVFDDKPEQMPHLEYRFVCHGDRPIHAFCIYIIHVPAASAYIIRSRYQNGVLKAYRRTIDSTWRQFRL